MTPPYIATWPEPAATLEYGEAARAPGRGPNKATNWGRVGRTLYPVYADAVGPIWSRSLYENVVLLFIVYVVKETTLPLWVDDL